MLLYRGCNRFLAYWASASCAAAPTVMANARATDMKMRLIVINFIVFVCLNINLLRLGGQAVRWQAPACVDSALPESVLDHPCICSHIIFSARSVEK